MVAVTEKRAEDEMDAEEFLAVHQQLLMLGELVQEIDVERFLRSIESSEGTARILLSGQQSLEGVKGLARGARVFKSALSPVESEKKTR